MIITSVYLNPDAMDGGYEGKKWHWKKLKKKKKKWSCMNMTTLMWFAAADIKCGHKVPVWHLQIKYMTVPYICKTRHAYNTTATEETPKK